MQRLGALTRQAVFVGAMFVPSGARAQGAGTDAIRLDQVGYYPRGPKIAVVVDSSATTFAVIAQPSGDTALRGLLSPPRVWTVSGETVRRADFSALTRAGRYVLAVPGVGRSYPFVVQAAALHDVARASLKAFYFQRASTALPARYAGRWARAAGHPDTAVLVHPSAASAARPAGTVVRSPGGWYDAGDYNKYVVNSGISTYTLLALYEHFPVYGDTLRLGIPESENAIPDILDEVLWNLRWMMTMQDPADGGVYHKLTNAEFDRFEMPERARARRYVVQKSTAATLDFAAVAAHAALVVRRFPRALPGLADSLVHAATDAWRWARAHPDSIYDQRRLNENSAPPIGTGTYGDRRVSDELQWAASELYLATRADSFLVVADPLASPPPDVPSWSSVRTLGLYSLVDHRRELPRSIDTLALERRLLAFADDLRDRARTSPYGVTIGAAASDFGWGSNALAANQGMALVQAYRVTGDTSYLDAAVASLDYLLGRNATGYAFLTGFGVRSPMRPHHRPSASDTVVAPVPGLLVGGPNPGQQDRCSGYTTRVPAKSYVDSTCNYSVNEIAINWNAPFAYLAGAVDAIFGAEGDSSGAPAPTRPAGRRSSGSRRRTVH